MENVIKPNSLYTLSEIELSVVLKPYYEEIINSLADKNELVMDYKHVVRDAYLNLQKYANAPIELQSQEIVDSFSMEEIQSFTTTDIIVDSLTSKCMMSAFTVMADVLGIVLTLVGINGTVTKNATRKLLNELGKKTLNGILSKIRDISHAGSFFERVKEIVALVMQIKNALGISAIIGAVKSELSFLQAVAAVAVMLAQFAIWFASDGVALVGELALGSVAVYQTISDSVTCLHECSFS